MKYLVALTNLYGIVHKDKVIEIFNMQNTENISEIIIKKNSVLVDSQSIEMHGLNRKFVYTYSNYFVNQSILEYDNPKDLLAQKRNKPYYIPHKEELLRYEDSLYFEMTHEYKNLLKYLKSNVVKNDDRLAESICDDIQLHVQCGDPFSEILRLFERRNVIFEDEKQLQEIIIYINLLMNNTRIWVNNGHTPNELSGVSSKEYSQPSPSEESDYLELSHDNSTPFIGNDKIGRNEPCPCGSGKKYKKCCLGKLN